MRARGLDPVIIVGAGLAGWTTAREFRKLDSSTPVLLITADSGDFYAKPSLSNAFAQGRAPAQLISTPASKMQDTLQVTLLANTQLQSINPQACSVTTSQGEFNYRQLVLATGAQPIRLALQGAAADQVQSINSLDDFARFHARLTGADSHDQNSATQSRTDRKKHVLIMGAGLIGCEFANDLVASGYQVSVVDPSAGPIAALLPPPASAELRQALALLGVSWHFGSTVKAVNQVAHRSGERQQAALQVALSDGPLVHVDRVLSAIGLRPDTALAQAAGLACERGILVDVTLRTSLPHIYALGDGAQYAAGQWRDGAPALAGGRALPYVMPIMQAARVLAANLAGSATELAFALMPVIIKTPALPIVVAAPAPGLPGDWRSAEPGLWHFIDAQGQVRGFVLTGKQTSRRAEQVKLVLV